MDVLPAEMPQMMGGYTAAETMVVPTIITGTITSHQLSGLPTLIFSVANFKHNHISDL